MNQQTRIQQIITLLKKEYPEAKMILTYSNNFELLVAVELSAQCTDIMVNKVTSKLFPKYQTQNNDLKIKYAEYKLKTTIPFNELVEIVNFAFADREKFEQDIKSTGFYKNKAKNLQAAAHMILENFHGELPKTISEMLQIPGVARKTANVVLGNAFNIYEGIAVDTHVKRLSERLSFTTKKTPEKIEQDLLKLVPKEDWFLFTYLLIDHGRAVCIAKKPKCDECILSKLCPSAFQFPHFKTGR